MVRRGGIYFDVPPQCSTPDTAPTENIPTLGSIYADIPRGRVEYLVYIVTKLLRKIRATTFTENYAELRKSAREGDEQTPLFQLVLVP